MKSEVKREMKGEMKREMTEEMKRWEKNLPMISEMKR